MNQKAELRTRLIRARQALTHTERQSLDKAIAERIQSCIDWSAIKSLHIYLPIERLAEPDTKSFIEWVMDTHPSISIYTPRLNEAGVMNSVRLKTNSEFSVGSYGEPVVIGRPELGVTYDVIIVPTLGFDQSRNRLGYGGGHYDRFLAQNGTAIRLGVAYECCFVDTLPVEDHDQKLSLIVTESRIYE